MSRKEPLLVYLKALDLTGENLRFFLLLLKVANEDNTITRSLIDLQTDCWEPIDSIKSRLDYLKLVGAVWGDPPLIKLNPFFASKCDGQALDKLRKEWAEENV